VRFTPSAELTAEDAAAIAAVSETEIPSKLGDPILKRAMKFHDKVSALRDLAKHLGILTERHEHSGPGGGPIPLMALEDAMLSGAGARAGRTAKPA
jgi:phage terminase small subunit